MTRGAKLTIGAVVAAVGFSLVVAIAVISSDDLPMPVQVGVDADQSPRSLVGAWWAGGDPLLEDALVVLLPSGELVAYTAEQCELMGSWSATESGLASMLINASSGKCGDLLNEAGAFSSTVARFEITDAGAELMDADGAVSATFTEADRSEWPKAVDVEYVTAELEGEFGSTAGGAELPEGYVAPTAADIVGGRWLPVGTAASDYWQDARRPHAQFLNSGRWTGADGCNGLGGTWSLDEKTGEWLASTGGQTDIGCRNVDVSAMVAPAATVGLDGDELVFFNDEGTEIGRFVREE